MQFLVRRKSGMISSGGFVQQLQVRADQFERRQQVAVDLFVVFAEGVAAGERDAALGFAEEAEEVRRKLFEALQDAVELRGAELLHAADHGDVAAQILERDSC